MKLPLLAFTLISTVSLALGVGCGGGNDQEGEILHLRNGDMSREDYRAYVRSLLRTGAYQDFCGGIRGLSSEEIVEAVLASQGEGQEAGESPEAVENTTGFTPVPDQAPTDDSRLAAAGIISEECERIAE